MGTDPLRISAEQVDFTGRIAVSTTVAASPADATETVIATLNLPTPFRTTEAVLLDGWAAFTVGTNGVSARLRIRETDVNGTVRADSDAVTGGIAAAGKVTLAVGGQDAAANGVYVLTLTVGSASAASIVSAVRLKAEVL